MNVIKAEEASRMFDISEKNAIHPNSKIRHCYLGRGLFNLDCLRQFKKDIEYENWFKSQTDLFIEYLNKIELISYTDMAKVIKMTIPAVATLNINLKKRAILLVKFRRYLKDFDKYYKGV